MYGLIICRIFSDNFVLIRGFLRILF